MSSRIHKSIPLLGQGSFFLVFHTLPPSLSQALHLTAAISSSDPRSLLIPKASACLTCRFLTSPNPFPLYTRVFFLSFDWNILSGRTIQIRRSVCVDTHSLWSLSCRTSPPHWKLPACIGCKVGIKRVERNMR